MRRRVVIGTTSSGSSSDGKTSAPNSGTAASSGSRNSPSTRTPFGCTGPPMKIGSPSSTSDSSAGTISATSDSVGRLSTSPAAPSSVCSVTSTTVRRKFGSSSPGDATSSCPCKLATWCERDEQPAVVVVRREEVAGDGLRGTGARAQLELLVEPPHAPLHPEPRRVAVVREAAQAESVDDVRTDQVGLAEAGQLED